VCLRKEGGAGEWTDVVEARARSAMEWVCRVVTVHLCALLERCEACRVVCLPRARSGREGISGVDAVRAIAHSSDDDSSSR